MSTVTHTIEMYPVDKIIESEWNFNVMPQEQYLALKADMKKNGPAGIDPILVARKKTLLNDPDIPDDIRVVISGNHRLRIAKELGWEKIPIIFDPAITSQHDARLISFQKNAERGNIDEFKLAENFKWLVNNGSSLEQIGKAYGMDRSTVGKRIKLLQVIPTVKEELTGIPGFAVSSFEAISTLKPEQQQEVTKRLKEDATHREVTTYDVEEEARRVRLEEKVKKEMADALAKSEYKICPKCGKEAERPSWNGLPWVHCAEDHSWNLSTGRLYAPSYSRTVEKKEKPKVPQEVATEIPFKKAAKTITQFALIQIGRFREFDSIDVQGRTSRANAQVSVDAFEGGSIEVQYSEGQKRIGFKVTSKDNKAVFTQPQYFGLIDTPYALKKFQDGIAYIFKGEYKPEKRPRGRPKKAKRKTSASGKVKAND